MARLTDPATGVLVEVSDATAAALGWPAAKADTKSTAKASTERVVHTTAKADTEAKTSSTK